MDYCLANIIVVSSAPYTFLIFIPEQEKSVIVPNSEFMVIKLWFKFQLPLSEVVGEQAVAPSEITKVLFELKISKFWLSNRSLFW